MTEKWKFMILAFMNFSKFLVKGKYSWDLFKFFAKGSFIFRVPKGIEGGVLYDVGGYKGFFTQLLALMNPHSTVHVYEPHPKFIQNLRKVAEKHENVVIHEYGLADVTGQLTFCDEQDASRSSVSSDATQFLPVVRMSEAVTTHVDFMTMNIEGGEYNALNDLIENEKVHLVSTLQIQFHFYESNHIQEYENIVQKLALTHTLEWKVPGLWEQWVINEKIQK